MGDTKPTAVKIRSFNNSFFRSDSKWVLTYLARYELKPPSACFPKQTLDGGDFDTILAGSCFVGGVAELSRHLNHRPVLLFLLYSEMWGFWLLGYVKKTNTFSKIIIIIGKQMFKSGEFPFYFLVLPFHF